MTPLAKKLIDQFNAALGRVSSVEHLDVQRQVADLLLRKKTQYSEHQVAIFNEVINCLVQNIDRRAVRELSGRLAAADHAPHSVIDRLSNNDDIAVAGPLLEKSKVLSDEILVEIAKTKGQDHLLAIAGRAQVSETVTDALVDRGNAKVTQKIAENDGARLSEIGFVKAVHGARSDETLASALAGRKDVPPELQPFLKLAREPVKAPWPSAPVAAKAHDHPRPQEHAKPQDHPKPQHHPKPQEQAKPQEHAKPQGKPKEQSRPDKPKADKWVRISRSSSGSWEG
jgi:uncharacterized protein (DUF2336 family)